MYRMKTHGLESGLKTHERNTQCLQCCANLTSQLGSTETDEATISAISGKRSKKLFFVYIIINLGEILLIRNVHYYIVYISALI